MNEKPPYLGGNGIDEYPKTSPAAPKPNPQDWKAIIAGAALFWTISLGVGKFSFDYLLSAVDDRVDLSEGRIATKLEAFSSRLLPMESHCASVKEWRGNVDIQLNALQDWRERCGHKMERLTQYSEFDRQDMADLKAKIDKLEDRIQLKHQKD